MYSLSSQTQTQQLPAPPRTPQMSIMNDLSTPIFLDMTPETKQIYEYLYYCLSVEITPSYQIGYINMIHRMIDNLITIEDLTTLIKNKEVANAIAWKIWIMDDIDRYQLINKLIIGVKAHIKAYSTSINTSALDIHISAVVTNKFLKEVDVSLCNDYVSCIMIFWYMKFLYINYKYVNKGIDLPNILSKFIPLLYKCIENQTNDMYKNNLIMIHKILNLALLELTGTKTSCNI